MRDHSPLVATLVSSSFGLLGFGLVALKLSGLIHWSWWWVSLPLWGPPVLVALAFAGFYLFLAAYCRWQLIWGKPVRLARSAVPYGADLASRNP